MSCHNSQPLTSQMDRRRIGYIGLSLAVLGQTALLSFLFGQEREPTPAKSRSFLFTYQARITDVEPGKKVRVWIPLAATNEDQAVAIEKMELPARGHVAQEPKYGNRLVFFETPMPARGELNMSIVYRVKRLEVRADLRSPRPTPEEVALFLKPDTRVPVGGKTLKLVEGRSLPRDNPLALARTLYDVVNDHMRYSKEGTGWGQGDAEWACDSRYGNCSDFHSLFISLARAHHIPAKFEIGFPLPPKRGQGEIPGYHCWAKFHVAGRGWIPVDISEANKVKNTDPAMVEYYFGNLTEDRVTFSVGRDLMLVPRQDGPPVNFFIYPYAEVDGKPLPSVKIHKKFLYEDCGDA
ncbi:MAG: transglutaminase [Gemmataceae bacterium]